MPAAEKKGVKKGTKLSLTKKTKKPETSTHHRIDETKNLLAGKVDLNETCDFQQPLKFPGCGDSKVKVDRKLTAETTSTKVKVPEKSSEETVRCQVCNKELSHMNVQRREQHVNKCIDKVEDIEKQQKEEQLLLEAAKTAVLDCPMCGKQFKAENSRLVHLKKCSVNVGVTTERMIHLVKEQEQDRQQQLAAGIVPKEIKSKITKPTAPKKRKLKEPKRLEDVCLLTTLTDEDRQRRMEAKVSHILHVANNSKYSKGVSLLESNLKADTQLQGSRLWERCSQEPVTGDNEHFYVGALVPPLSVSKSEPGTKLRRLSSIPGREKSFVKKKEISSGKCSEGNSDMMTEDVITASTQTAVILAELAVDDTDILDNTVSSQLIPGHKTTDNIVDLQASGFCVEKMVLNKSEQDIQVSQALLDYKKMINNREYSDVTLISCSGESFSAHQLILAARCPKLLQMMEDSAITLDTSSDTVLSFLNYIYTGDVTLTSSSQSELLKLAKELELPFLKDACDKVVLQTESSETVDLKDNPERSETEFIESHIDMKEIWGESDSDLDPENGDESGDVESQYSSGINDEDYREISCTQKQKLRASVHISPTTNDSKRSDRQQFSDNNLILNFSNDKIYDLNEIGTKVLNDQSDEADGTSDMVRMSYSPEVVRDKSALNTKDLEIEKTKQVIEVDVGVVKDDNEQIIEVDVESNLGPNPKRLKLSIEAVDEKYRTESENVNISSRSFRESSQDSSHRGSGDFSKTSYVHVNNIIDVDEENGNDTMLSTGMNSSSADLFDSPSPRKLEVTVANTGNELNVLEFSKQNLQSGSKFSTPLEYKSGRTLNTSELPITPVERLTVDLDSSVEENTQLNEFSSNQSDTNQIKHAVKVDSIDSLCNKKEQNVSSTHDYEIDKDLYVDLQSINQNVSGTSKGEIDLESSDDDLQITGDNFDELTQQSPTFKHNKMPSAGVNMTNSGHKVDETKYLGVKSVTEGLSEPKQTSGEAKCVNPRVKVLRNVKLKHFADSASDSEEIVTIQTEDSDGCESDESEKKDRKVTEDSAKESCSKSYDECNVRNEFSLSRSPLRYGRVSTAYGKHEISVYSADEGKSDLHSTSFEANTTDVWEDFDDCGVGYEPPVCSPGEEHEPSVRSPEGNSPMSGVELQEECPEDMSPVIPTQSEVIDLSDSEDDSNICGNKNDTDLDGALLEDGDDSFVFKVNDETEASETPTAKHLEKKQGDFKTPTTFEKNCKNKPEWVPPSPFTPMPQYGVMPTPALKKAVQRYGVKPVSKKRMIKVLEDIYQQTHQYETDSEVEEEDEASTETAQELSGGGAACSSLSCSQDDISSQDSDISDVLEESCLHMMSSDSDTPVSPKKNADITKQLYDFIKLCPEIHAKVLTYEPLELDVLKKDVKEAGIKCSMDKLMDFLDERCIAFTSKNSRKRQTGRRGKQKATKSKQTEK